MSARHSFAPAVCIAVVLAAIAAPAGADMAMGASYPEHVSAALGALAAGNTATARSELQAAISDHQEPKAARKHAAKALAALTIGNASAAGTHATSGAGVEHFTYSLRALKARRLTGADSASVHLEEARMLPPFKRAAEKALKAIARNKLAAARRAIRSGLRAASRD